MLPQKINSLDDYQTPSIPLNPLIPFLKKNWIIWEPADGKGNLSGYLRERESFNVIGTDILVGKDFLKWNPKRFDCIITNPPYSLKQQFLERCYELRKPFALLLPLTTFETQKRQKLFRDFGVEIIFLPNRINFETPSGKGSGAWFATAWFTNWLNIGQQLTFSKV